MTGTVTSDELGLSRSGGTVLSAGRSENDGNGESCPRKPWGALEISGQLLHQHITSAAHGFRGRRGVAQGSHPRKRAALPLSVRLWGYASGMAITKLPNGKYQHDYRVDGRRRYKRFRTRAEALAHQLQIDTAKAGGTLIDTRKGGRMPVQRLFEEWIARIEDVGARGMRASSPVTVAGYRRIHDNHIKPHFEFRPLAQVSLQVVNEWLSTFHTDDARQRAYRQLGRMLQYAVDSGYMASNPARNAAINNVPTPEPAREPTALTPDQLKALARAARDVAAVGGAPSSAAYCLIMFAGTTGLRWSEVAGLRVRSLDLSEQSNVKVQSALVPVNGKLVLRDTTKGRKPRTVPIPSSVAKQVAAQVEGKLPDSLVFTAPSGAELRSSNFARRVFHPAVKRCQAEDRGFPEMVFHDLRRTAVSLAISGGANVKVVQQIAGHTSAVTTLDVYAQYYEADLHSSASAVDRLLADA